MINKTSWEHIKWLANVCFIVSTMLMLSPSIASTSLTPWILYLLGNTIWGVDSYVNRNKPWLFLASFFCVWDILVIFARIFDVEILNYIQDIISITL